MFLLLISGFSSDAQMPNICGTSELGFRPSFAPSSANRDPGEEVIIPLYFHDFGDNVSFQSYIEEVVYILNQLYTYKTSTPNINDMYLSKIRFKLANFNEEQHCFNGYKKYFSQTIDFPFVYDPFLTTFFDSPTLEYLNTHYLNIFCFKEIGGAAGAYYQVSPNIIAMDIDENFNYGVSQFAEVLAHEVGHFLGLDHPFSISECIDNDGFVETAPCDLATVQNERESCIDFETPCSGTLLYDYSNVMSYDHPNCNVYNDFFDSQLNQAEANLIANSSYLISEDNLLTVLGQFEFIDADRVFANEIIENKQFFVSPDVKITINGGVTFSSSMFQFSENGELIVPNFSTLNITNRSTLTSDCSDESWKGIKLSGTLNLNGSSIIGLADIGILSLSGSELIVHDATFYDCFVGVQFGEDSAPNLEGAIAIDNTKFIGKHYKKYNRSSPDPYDAPKPEIGIYLKNINRNILAFGNNYFEWLKYGIKSEDLKTYLVSYQEDFKQVDFGIHIRNGNRNVVSAYNDKINYHVDGISLSRCYFDFHSLELVNGNDQGAYDKIGLNLKACYGLWSDQSVTNVLCEGEFTTIFNSYFSHNYTIENLYCIPTNNAAMGINLIYNDRVNIKQSNIYAHLNNIKSTYRSKLQENDLQIGVLDITNSTGNQYNCNLMDNIKNVGSYGQSFIANDISSEFNFENRCIGARLKNNFSDNITLTGPTTIISPQRDGGNVFVEGRYDTDDKLIEDNRIYVGNDCVPMSNIPLWFSEDENLTCDGPINCDGIGPGTDFAPPWDDDKYDAACLDSLYAGTRYSHLSPRQKWSLLFALYRFYKKTGTELPFALSDCGAEILNIKRYEDIGKIDTILTRVEAIINQPVDTNLLHTIHTKVLSWKSNVASGNDAGADILYSELSNLRDQQIASELIIAQSYNTEKSDIINALGSVNASNSIATALLEVIPYIFDVYEGVALSDADIATLAHIATGCDEEVGDARYHAMHLYEIATGRNDLAYASCEQDLEPRIEASAAANSYSIYPNPVSDKIVAQCGAGSIITIYNRLGQEVMAFDASGEEIRTLDISTLIPDMYIVAIYDEQAVRHITKFIKI